MQLKYFAIDPGEDNGVVFYDEHTNVQVLKVVSFENLVKFLWGVSSKHPTIEKGVYESYRVYPNKTEAHIYSDLKTARAIGKIEAWAEVHGIKLYHQPSDCMNTGFNYLGKRKPPRSNPMMDAFVAAAHGAFWMVKYKIKDPRDFLK